MLHLLLDNEIKQLLVAKVAQKVFHFIFPVNKYYRCLVLSGPATEVVEDRTRSYGKL